MFACTRNGPASLLPHSPLTRPKFADNVPSRSTGPCCKYLTSPPEASMFAPPVVSRRSVVLCLLAVSFLTTVSFAQHPQDVTTWHNDNNRTGWQSHEGMLIQSNVRSNFGLLWQWQVQGWVFAEPLAVASVQ